MSPTPRWAVVAQGESPYAWISASCSWHSGPMTRLQARWIATAVPCRPREAQSRLWSHNGGANDATVKNRRSWGVPLRMHIVVWSTILGLFGAKTSSIVVKQCSCNNAFIISLAHNSHRLPSAGSAVTVVVSQHRGDRSHGGRRSLEAESPYAWISASSSWYASPMTRLHAR